jgi:hypothetical protein
MEFHHVIIVFLFNLEHDLDQVLNYELSKLTCQISLITSRGWSTNSWSDYYLDIYSKYIDRWEIYFLELLCYRKLAWDMKSFLIMAG